MKTIALSLLAAFSFSVSSAFACGGGCDDKDKSDKKKNEGKEQAFSQIAI